VSYKQKSLYSKCPPFALTRVQTGAPLSDCRINNTLVKFTVMSDVMLRETLHGKGSTYGGQLW